MRYKLTITDEQDTVVYQAAVTTEQDDEWEPDWSDDTLYIDPDWWQTGAPAFASASVVNDLARALS